MISTRFRLSCIAFTVAVAGILGHSPAQALPPGVGFAPPAKPFTTGTLKVSDLHEIYFELSGNPQGIPAFWLHGGPGTGFSERDRQVFDPTRFLVVLADQRGCGRSRPEFELRQNTTQDLTEDIERLRVHLKLGKILLVGGSWGSTLALAYAETYPRNVAGLILRAVFLGTEEERRHVYNHGGLEKFFPEAFAKMAQEVRPGARDIDRKRLAELLASRDDATAGRISRLWSWYELKITNLEASDAVIDKILAGHFPSRGLALIQNHYEQNDWFLKENQLMKNASVLRDIPIIMVQGRYDMMTPPITAYRLHKSLPKAQLRIVESSGHSDWDPGIAKGLIEAVAEFGRSTP